MKLDARCDASVRWSASAAFQIESDTLIQKASKLIATCRMQICGLCIQITCTSCITTRNMNIRIYYRQSTASALICILFLSLLSLSLIPFKLKIEDKISKYALVCLRVHTSPYCRLHTYYVHHRIGSQISLIKCSYDRQVYIVSIITTIKKPKLYVR